MSSAAPAPAIDGQQLLQRNAAHVGDHAASPYSSWQFHHWYGGVCG